jgi:hypothetical protein
MTTAALLLLSDMMEASMATRSEQHHAAEVHENQAKNAKGRTPKTGSAPNGTRNKKHAGRKATYALEESGAGRPSRKSTRKSANHAKPDAGLNVREELRKGSPTARYRRAHAQTA